MSIIIDKKELKSAANRKKLTNALLELFDEAATTSAETIQIDVIPMVQKKYYKTNEIAEVYQVSDRMVRKWCSQGKISALRTPGGSWRIPTSVFGDLQKVKAFQETAEQINERFSNYPEIDDFEK